MIGIKGDEKHLWKIDFIKMQAEECLLELISIRNNLKRMLELAEQGVSEKAEELHDLCIPKENRLALIDNSFQLSEIKTESINKLITKHIDGKYAYANYAGVEVLMMVSNGYINATKLCALGGKRFDKWSRLDSSKDNISEVENEINSIRPDLGQRIPVIISIKGGNNQLVTGSYVHPWLIINVAMWLSPKFSIAVNKIINNYVIAETERKNQMILKAKDDKIDELNVKIDHVIKQNNEQKQEIAKLMEKNDELLQKAKSIDNKLSHVKKEYVVKTGQEKDDSYLVIYNNYKKKPSARGSNDFEYTALRLMSKSFMTRTTSHLQKYKHAVDILTIENPYANNLWQRIKKDLNKNGIIDCNYVSFNLQEGYTEQQLLKYIRNIDEVRFRI